MSSTNSTGEISSINRALDKALLLESEIAGLKNPEDRVTEAVKHIFEQPHHILGGKAKFLFEDKPPNAFNDLVALKPSGESDFLSDFLRRHWRAEVTLSSKSPSLDIDQS